MTKAPKPKPTASPPTVEDRYDLATFPARLRRLRGGVPRTAVAAAIGSSHEIIFRWESGRGYPTLPMLTRLAAHYDVTLDELVGLR